jgi:hypothetical protein
MSKFTYRRGTWEDGYTLPEQGDDEEFDTYRTRIGYASSPTRFGHADSNQFELYGHPDGSFLADVSFTHSHCFEVFLPDFPSAMLFIRDHAAGFSLDESNITHREVLTLLEKLFQAQHGHASHEICAKCDPEGWEKRQKFRREKLYAEL